MRSKQRWKKGRGANIAAVKEADKGEIGELVAFARG